MFNSKETAYILDISKHILHNYLNSPIIRKSNKKGTTNNSQNDFSLTEILTLAEHHASRKHFIFDYNGLEEKASLYALTLAVNYQNRAEDIVNELKPMFKKYSTVNKTYTLYKDNNLIL